MILLMHHHIYKNAGTTIDWILEKNFQGSVLYVEGRTPGARLLPRQIAEVLQRHAHKQCVSSHTTPLPAAKDRWADYHLVMLRDPIERFYSQYLFARRSGSGGPDNEAAQSKSFDDYCRWWAEVAGGRFMNWQARCCTPQSSQSVQSDKGWRLDLDVAREALATTAVVGTVEQFDDSMILLEADMTQAGVLFDAAYRRQNVSRSPADPTKVAGARELLGDYCEQFAELNSFDIELHDYARGNVDRRVASLPDHDARRVSFRERCRKLDSSHAGRAIRVPGREAWIVVGDDV